MKTMQDDFRVRPVSMRQSVFVLVSASLLTLGVVSPASVAQAPASQSPAASPAPGSRVAGTVTAIAGNVLTVRDDKGNESKVTVQDSARVMQLPAGSTNLGTAVKVTVQEIAVGDRVLAKTAPAADGNGLTASTVITMKQADVAQKQQQDRKDWQTRGVSGLVKSVDPNAQTISISTGNGPTAKTIVVQASKTTNIRRYAPDSTKFDDAKAATLDQIKPGDQLRAKGEKNADGSELTADAIVAGTFRNIAGTVVSVDPAANALTVKDLVTKKPFTVNINADSQLHKLPPAMAQGIAMRLKGGSAGGPGGNGAAGSQAPAAAGAPGAPAAAAAGGAPSGQTPGGRGGDLQQMLNRAPVLQLADLKAGDAVMVLTTEGQTPGAATAITLIAGVEPLLQASPAASQSMLSASWNLGGGAAGQEAQ
jgi:transcription antitermination factor NusG